MENGEEKTESLHGFVSKAGLDEIAGQDEDSRPFDPAERSAGILRSKANS
jgi:hypothetical protein